MVLVPNIETPAKFAPVQSEVDQARVEMMPLVLSAVSMYEYIACSVPSARMQTPNGWYDMVVGVEEQVVSVAAKAPYFSSRHG